MPPSSGATVIVTGAAGFVGSAAVDAPAWDFDVIACAVHAPSKPSADAEFIPLDVTSDASVEAAFRRIRSAHGSRIALLHEQNAGIPVIVLRAAGVYDEPCHAAFLDHHIARIQERRLTSHVSRRPRRGYRFVI